MVLSFYFDCKYSYSVNSWAVGGFKCLDPGYVRPLPLSTFASCVTRPSYFSSADFSPASFYPSSSIRWSSWILSSLSMAFLGHLMCFFIYFRTLRTPQKHFRAWCWQLWLNCSSRVELLSLSTVWLCTLLRLVTVRRLTTYCFCDDEDAPHHHRSTLETLVSQFAGSFLHIV